MYKNGAYPCSKNAVVPCKKMVKGKCLENALFHSVKREMVMEKLHMRALPVLFSLSLSLSLSLSISNSGLSLSLSLPLFLQTVLNVRDLIKGAKKNLKFKVQILE